MTEQSWQVLERSSCVLQTPILLTPSPLLSSIHFWSTLSPFAPLSPARLQGANTLFQVNYTVCLLSLGNVYCRNGQGLCSVSLSHTTAGSLLFLVIQYVIGELWLSVAAQHSKKLSYWKLLAQKNTDVQGIVSIECIWHFLCSVKLNHCKSGSLCTCTTMCVHTKPIWGHI